MSENLARWYLDDVNRADFQSRGKEEGLMISEDLEKTLMLTGLAGGLLALLVPLLVLAVRVQSRRQQTFWKSVCLFGVALMGAIWAVASLNHSFLPIFFAFFALFAVLGAVMNLAYPRFEFPTWVRHGTAQRIRRIEDESRVLTPQEVVQAYHQGDLWLSELPARLGRSLAAEDVARWIASLSPDLRRRLQRHIEDRPQTEKELSRSWRYQFAMWCRKFHRRSNGIPRRQVDAEVAQEVGHWCRGVEILRDGISPFPPGARVLDPSLLGWNDGTILKLAQAIRDERAFEQMPILADALEDAGCANEQILGHLRGPGPHHRACWCLALILEQASDSDVRDSDETVS